ncbi:hypothetical protein IU500_18515 [Nocardia terpenica]|uniref:hypothetical protein n=1 Tax=Nocardia terpenica TaxID=455432 RepID=UPI001894D018|nr:hypothetical protein [Nocardia terpenica]MBF6063480.1 hypothetical protein [Nocardia terpenica]MBF6106036.1 hypothetical protein [Nocardia terpenica]MBF6113379.1 hypothetical protein [Nocardia terpenica]MBF6119777.1 hypothetical protein [Nocardia terpenica]MBF6152188.1 hypothetical protein [Nocardia terpenica]
MVLPDLHAAPTNLRTTVFHGITLPIADQGPHHDDGTVATGFDHNPVGAALAGIHAIVRISVATDAEWPRIGQHMLAPGVGDAWALARAQLSAIAVVGTPPTVLGYRIIRYRPDRADLGIYSRQSDKSLTCNTAVVGWQDDDWKLLFPDRPATPVVAAVASPPADMVSVTTS